MVSIIIQGKLHKHSLSRLQKYRKFGKVILCYDSDDNLDLLSQHDTSDIILIPISPEIPNTTFNCFNTWRQFWTTYNGLLRVETPFAIKVRSDNFIGNLSPMIEKMLLNPDKIISAALYFRPDAVAKFHPSDQLFGGPIELLLKGLEIACYRMENHSKELREAFNDHRMLSNDKFLYHESMSGSKINNASEPLPRGVGIAPEVLLGTSIVAAKGLVPSIESSKAQMKECFDIIRIEELIPYLSKDGNTIIPHGGAEIFTIDEL